LHFIALKLIGVSQLFRENRAILQY